MDFSSLLEYDKTLLLAFNNNHNMFLDHVVLVFTSGYTWRPLYVSLFYLIVKNNEKWGRILLIMGSLALCMLISNAGNGGFVKPYIARLRPSSDPLLAHTLFLVNGYAPSGFSFFSAHACNAFSVAVFFMYLVRSRLLSIFLLVWAFIVVWTRLYLGVHYPSDIFVGMVAGTLNASLCYLIYKRIERRVAPVSTYRTKQFTRTGYEVKDIDVVLCTIVFTCIYCIIRGVIEIGL